MYNEQVLATRRTQKRHTGSVVVRGDELDDLRLVEVVGVQVAQTVAGAPGVGHEKQQLVPHTAGQISRMRIGGGKEFGIEIITCTTRRDSCSQGGGIQSQKRQNGSSLCCVMLLHVKYGVRSY